MLTFAKRLVKHCTCPRQANLQESGKKGARPFSAAQQEVPEEVQEVVQQDAATLSEDGLASPRVPTLNRKHTPTLNPKATPTLNPKIHQP